MRPIKEVRDGKLIEVQIPNGLETLPTELFAVNQLTSITIPNNIKYIYSGVLRNNPINSVTIGQNVDIQIDDYSNYYVGDGPIPDDAQKNFALFYNQTGKRAGTYKLTNNRWTYVSR
jgi:hypothetical protein